ncbi:hypothetical protein pb186bvf_015258 [Paramecium bursaria]
MAQEIIEAIKNYRCCCGSLDIIKICFQQSCYPLFCDKCESNHQTHKSKTCTIRDLFDFLSHENVISRMTNDMIDRINQFAKTFSGQMEHIISQLNSKKQIIDVSKLRNQVEKHKFQEIKDKIDIIVGPKILQNFEDQQDKFFSRIEYISLDINNLSISSIEESNNHIADYKAQSEITFQDKEISIFSQVLCLNHENQIIDRICLHKEGQKQKGLCEICEKDHKEHRDQVHPFEEFRTMQHFNYSPFLKQDLSIKLEQFLLSQQQEFLNKLKMIQPNKLVLNYIIDSKDMSVSQIQQRFHKLSQSIDIDKQNKMEFNIDKISDLLILFRLRRLTEIVESQNIVIKQQLQQQSEIQQSEIIQIDQNQFINSSFTQEYCSEHIRCMSQKIIRKIKYYNANDIACLNIPLNNLDYKSYRLIINNSTGLIWIGIAKLQQLIEQQFIYDGQNNGFYLVCSNGYCYNSIYKEFNNKKKSICMDENTDFIFTYDRKQYEKEFQININENSFYMPLPSFMDEQMSMVPCIIMENQESEIELISEL